MKTLCTITCLILGLMSSRAFSATNINETNSYSWAANAGFMNWRADGENGVLLGRYILSGFIYGANIGWISVGDGTPDNGIQYSNASATDFGVNTIADPSVP